MTVDIEDILINLETVRDYIRYGVSIFTRADISYGHGTVTAFDESVFIVLEGLRLPIDNLEPFLDARLSMAEREKILDLLTARVETRKPASYLLNKAYIQGLPFYVDERVIVPRSFIAEILARGDDVLPDLTPPDRILDLCTGSGCLAIMAAHMYPDAMVDAVDLSPDALDVARRNVADHGLEDRVELLEGDLFAPLKGLHYDLIITNPPYVGADVMAALPEEYRHEPAMALQSGVDGFDIVRRILKEAPQYLTPRGLLICEFGEGRDALQAEFPHLPFNWLETEHSNGEVFTLTRNDFE